MTLRVSVRIDARAAILARKAVAGILQVDITEENLAGLTEPELVELANIYDAGEILEGSEISAPTFDVVLHVLKTRVEAKVAAENLAKEDEVGRRRAEARAAEQALVDKREKAARDIEYGKAITAWLVEHGDEDLRERYAAGFADMKEVIEEVMHQTFEINEDEHVPLRKELGCDCERGCVASVRFTVSPVLPNVTPLDTRQWATLARIREAAPAGAVVEARVHKASCPDCKCAPLARLTALVSLDWNGWRLMKEYSLE